MAEIKTGIFAKNVQKRLNRAQEKVLQKLGKADETKDEQFEQVVVNFRRQESEGSRLQREMKSYMAAIKGMQQASINLTQSLHEVYEPDWHGKDDVMVIGKDSDALWEDFHNKLVDSTLLNLDAYLQQFPDLKTRVAKRSRKLIDYDSARHHVETLQVSGMKSDRKMMKADDELRKAQKVFDELNVGLQDELPTLWDSRVGFYISTYKSVTSLEAKFHREISLVCRQLYEVMTQLAEQHSDKMFTIQGAPSDSGPLRLARTPSPPEDESPPESPDASANHMLRPVSPGPPRPKSPTQGPPVPPPPKATPSKEVAEEQIIDLFGGEFLPAPSPSQPNERPGESLLDLDFDAFQPDDSVSPIPQTAVPWDMWSADAETAPPAADDSFVANWSADFGSLSPNEDAASGAEASAAGLEGAQGGAQGQDQGLNQTKGWKSEDSEAVRSDEDEAGKLDSGGYGAGQEDRRKSTPGLVFTNEFGQEIEDSTADKRDKWSRSPDGSGSEYETAEEWGDGIQGGGWASADDELSSEDPPANTSEGWKGGGEDVAIESYRPGKEQQSELTSDSTGHSVTNTTQGGGAFDLSTATETQGGGAFDLSTVAETQGGRAFDLSTVAETQGGGAFDLSTATETQGGGAFDLSTATETQGGGAFDLSTVAETQGGGAFDLSTVAETQGGGAFDLSTVAETQGGGAFDSDPFAETQGGGAFDLSTATETQGGGAFDSDPFAETQGGGAFDSDPFAETQGGGAFDSDPFAETQGGGAFDSDPFAETQGGGAFDLSTATETQGGGAFDSDPFAETQGGGAFDSDPFAETQGGGAFDSDPFAETQGGGAFDSDPFAETQGGGAFDSDPFAETQGGGAFDSDPFAETQGGGAFDSDPFAETQGGGAFDLSTATETQGGGAFDSDPFAETQGGGAFDSDPFAETQGGGAFDSDPFAETQGGGAFDLSTATETQGGGAFDSDPCAEKLRGDKGNDFELDPFAESSEGGEVVDTSDGKGGWDSDPFAQGFPAVSSGTGDAAFNVTSWQEANVISSSSVSGENSESISGEAADMIKDANVSRIHKEPENSDMSEDEAANRRLGKLYQELDTEKEEATDAFNGFSQDSSAPSFFADFDKMNEVNTESTEATEASQIDKPPVPPAGEEPATPPSDEETAAPPTGEEPAAPPVVEEPAAPPTGEETPAPPAGKETPAPPAEEEPAAPAQDETAAPPASQEIPAPPAEEEPAAPPSVEEPADPPAGEEIPVSPAREEPESFVNPKDEELDSAGASPGSEQAEIGQISPTEETSPAEATSSEKMPIPSVVIEPASSNEGDDDRDADIISPVAISDNGVTAENPAIKHMSPSGGVSGLPDDFLYKVETMHDFEAANSDELELKRGDVVLVVPTASLEDQDAGWLTGIRESDWLTLGTGAQKGLFPENFIQRLE
ncbi:amphiphysin isoform X2 [Labrus bergylta]|uniref:amphiphysin isoform X2 n=1 Tax=Labrus bergylta TaxID=56723 RepID=UPI0033131F24